MQTNIPLFKHSRALLTLAVALLVVGCDPEAEDFEVSSEALVAEDHPDQIGVAETPQAAPPQNDGKCSGDFRSIGGRLCIDEDVRQPLKYHKAATDCRDSRARVCTIEDFFYVYQSSNLDPQYNPKQGNRQRWIGNYVGDDTVLCGDRAITQNNDPDQDDFDTECSAQERHAYWCCRDRGPGNWGGDDDDWDDDDDDGWDGN